jgi:hypothetical protein
VPDGGRRGAVDLFFDYGHNRWERVRVFPTGSGRITAPARTPRRAAFADDLAALSPPGRWRQVLRCPRLQPAVHQRAAPDPAVGVKPAGLREILLTFTFVSL